MSNLKAWSSRIFLTYTLSFFLVLLIVWPIPPRADSASTPSQGEAADFWNRLQPMARVNPVTPPRPDAAATYGQLPLRFEPNKGQAPGEALFVSHRPNSELLLDRDGVEMRLTSAPKSEEATSRQRFADHRPLPTPGARIKITLAGADPNCVVQGTDLLPGVSNYIPGQDRSEWRLGVPNYARVTYRSVYPGIDMVWYGKDGGLEYDLVLAPGADPSDINLKFEGVDRQELSASGDLVMQSPAGAVVEKRPSAYQIIGGVNRPVSARYRINGDGVAVETGDYDPAYPLVIDPVLTYSSFLGSFAQNYAAGAAVGASGDLFVTGLASYDFPITKGALQSTANGQGTFVSRFSPDGGSLIYSTYIGVGEDTFSNAMAVDEQGNAYLTGITGDQGFPTTPGAFQTTLTDGPAAFVLKLDPQGGSLIYSTLFGGSTFLNPVSIAIDPTGTAYVVGYSSADGLPVTPGAVDFHVSGQYTTFVTRVSADGSALVYSALLGGSQGAEANGIAVDQSGDAFVTGISYSKDFPVTQGAFQTTLAGGGNAFVSKLSPDGKTLLYSTFVGGQASDSGSAIAVDQAGSAYVVGTASSENFPTTPNSFDRKGRIKVNSVPTEVVVFKLNPQGSALIYSTYLGPGDDIDTASIAVDSSGSAWVGGSTASVDFPLVNPLQSVHGGGPIFKSSDGGAHWSRSGAGLRSSTVTQLIAIPGSPSTFLAGTGDDGVFRSTDSGESWKPTGLTGGGGGFSFGFPGGQVQVLAAVRSPSGRVYALTSNGLYRSTDAGSTWTPLASPPGLGLATVAADPVDLGVVYAAFYVDYYDATLFKSLDSGATWTPTALTGLAIPSLVIDPANHQRILVGSQGDNAGIYLSTDGGATWNLTNAPVGPVVPLSLGAGDHPRVYALDSSGDVFSSDDFGATWTDQGTQWSLPGLIGVFPDTTNPEVVYSGTENGLFRFAPDFSRMTEVDSGLDGNFVNAILADPQNDSVVFAGTGLGVKDVFLSKISPDGSKLQFSTYYGGTGDDTLAGLAADRAGSVYVAGTSYSMNLRTTPASFQPGFVGSSVSSREVGDANIFVFKLGAPVISQVSADGTDVVVTGSNFDKKAKILINGQQVPTSFDPQSSGSKLRAVGAVARIPRRSTVTVQVVNSDATASAGANFTRPGS